MALDNPPKDPLAIYEDKPVDDPDNPEWTEEDHRRAKPMPEKILDSFPKMRGRPRKPLDEKKIQISIKLHPKVLNHFKAGGPGWQTRMEQVLIDAAGGSRRARRFPWQQWRCRRKGVSKPPSEPRRREQGKGRSEHRHEEAVGR
jgi:uncharacterized protein (DUF4415 family)